MRTYTTGQYQSLADIAVEVYGDVAGVCWLLLDNPIVASVADRLPARTALLIRDEVMNVRMVRYLTDFAPFETLEEADKPQGVGYWFLEEYEVY